MPDCAIAELFTYAALALFGIVDMRRPDLDLIGAADASGSFGLDAAVARLPADAPRVIANLNCKLGGHVTLRDGVGNEVYKRLGLRHNLGLPMIARDAIWSTGCTADRHTNFRKMRALLTYVPWVLRQPGRFGHSLVVLVDSTVIVGVVTRGRSSLRRLALGGNLVLHVVYIPTGHNTPDAPSRGIRPRRRRTKLAPRHATRLERVSGLFAQAVARAPALAAPTRVMRRPFLRTEAGYEADIEMPHGSWSRADSFLRSPE